MSGSSPTAELKPFSYWGGSTRRSGVSEAPHSGWVWWLQLPSIDLRSQWGDSVGGSYCKCYYSQLGEARFSVGLISFHLNLEWKQRSVQSAVLRTASQPDRFPISSRLAGEMREAAEKEERLYRPPSDTFALQ